MADSPENIDIEGSVAVVTGGANGIGKGIVKALLSRGGISSDRRYRRTSYR